MSGSILVEGNAPKKKPHDQQGGEDAKARRDADDVRKIASSPEGQRFIWRYLAITGVFESSYSPEAPEGTFFNEGRRVVGTTLLAEVMKHAPEAFIKMLGDDLKGRN